MIFCKKCKKEIPDGSVYCCWCGKKQITVKRRRAKRANGTGHIHKKNGMYEAYAPSAKDKTHGKYIGIYKTVSEAQTALEKFKKGEISSLQTKTVKDVYEMWSDIHFRTLTSSGEQGYKSAWNYLKPIENQKMRDVKTADFQMCIDLCAENYGRSSCEKVKQLCSQLCKYSMQNDLITQNYAQFLVLPKEEKKEKSIFTDEELSILWENSQDPNVQLILILCYTGLRLGELITIKKENVYLSDDKNYIIGGIKTEAGKNRIIPINKCILPFVTNLYNNSQNEYLYHVEAKTFRNNVFYFTLAKLGFIDQPIRNKKTNKLEYKNPRLTPHCTRHTFASLAVRSNISPESLKLLLGHASYSTTVDHYVHENFEQLDKSIHQMQVTGDITGNNEK